MDFEPYLQRLVSQFEKGDPDQPTKPPMASYYVDLMITDSILGVPKVLIAFAKKWLSSAGQKLAVLGEYGFGKTVFCKKLARDLAAEYISAHKGRIPLLINLGKFPRIAADLQALIINHLVQNCDIVNPSWAAFERMNDAGMLLLIFDGLDEMAVRTNREVVEQNLFEIEKLAKSPFSKIIITSRPEYFWTNLEEKELLSLKGLVFGKRSYEICKLTPFSVDQIKSYLQKRIPLVRDAKHPWTYYFDFIKKIYDLPDLSKRPVFLEMICETLPKMIADGIPVNRNSLYENYLSSEIKRQEIEKRRALKLPAKERFKLMQLLAQELFRNRKDGLTSRETLELLREHLSEEQMQELEGNLSDFLACSFLRRQIDTFVFSHQTILEFFVSNVLLEEIIKKKLDIFTNSALSEAILDFLSEKLIESSLLWNIIVDTKKLSDKAKSESFAASNAISLLNRIGFSFLYKDLSNLNLKEARLKKANLTMAELNGTNLNFADLSSAVLFKAKLIDAKLEKTKLSNANLSEATFERATLSGAILTSANLKSTVLIGANLEKTNLTEANLTAAVLQRANLISSKLIAANFTEANMANADLRCARLDNANLSKANLSHANLSGAILSKATLLDANFEKAQLANADLIGADIRGANLDTPLFKTRLYGVKFDYRTKISKRNIDVYDSLRHDNVDRNFAEYLAKKFSWTDM